MNLIPENRTLALPGSRTKAFATFARERQKRSRQENDLLTYLSEGSGNLESLLEEVNEHITTLSHRKRKNLHDLLGDASSIVTQAKKGLTDAVLPLDWFHDAQLQMHAVHEGLFTNKFPGILKKADFHIAQGLLYFREATAVPNFSREATKHFIAARMDHDNNGYQDPYLYYCLGLCHFYFNFKYHEAVALFKEAISYSFIKGSDSLIAKCHAELGKLCYIMSDEKASLKHFKEAVIHDQEFTEAKFNLLQSLILTKEDTDLVLKLLEELKDINHCYLLKIIADKTLMGDRTVVSWLISIAERETITLCGKVQELKDKHSAIFAKGLYHAELSKIEEALLSGKYFELLPVYADVQALNDKVYADVRLSETKLKDLEYQYSSYISRTWEDNIPLQKLWRYIKDMKIEINNGMPLADEEDYDLTDLEREYHDWDEKMRDIEREWGVNLRGKCRKNVPHEIKRAIIKEKTRKLREKLSPDLDNERTLKWLCIAGACVGFYALYMSWNWHTSSEIHPFGSILLNYLLFLLCKVGWLFFAFIASLIVVAAVSMAIWFAVAITIAGAYGVYLQWRIK